jgi:hypothetical protein
VNAWTRPTPTAEEIREGLVNGYAAATSERERRTFLRAALRKMGQDAKAAGARGIEATCAELVHVLDGHPSGERAESDAVLGAIEARAAHTTKDAP